MTFGAWKPNNQFRIEFSSNLPQELTKIVEYCPKYAPRILENTEFEHFYQKLHFY